VESIYRYGARDNLCYFIYVSFFGSMKIEAMIMRRACSSLRHNLAIMGLQR
jgi:hypothetical protein